ncbi:TonB C-terminal domain-containing protein [Thalassolituus sp. LLYu03]|uniref:TonB C-terminal domain-containing protein n=1 Tax=Thalassolituus sp. LLYu03 TaxID=3421656 RepID=UPI003D2DA9F3
MHRIPDAIRRHPLVSALTLSALLHLLFLWPDTHQTPPAMRVINADLRLTELSAQTLKTPADHQPPASADGAPAADDEAPATSTDEPQTTKPTGTPITPRKAAAATRALTTPEPATEAVEQKKKQEAASVAQPGLTDRQDELSSDPVERQYQQQILAHLRQQVEAPAGFSGSVRLSLTIRYGQIATDVDIVRSSGDPAIDDWAVKAAIGANPYPQVPPQLPQPYHFRPTLSIGQ